jgi:thiamine monophosphate synthase
MRANRLAQESPVPVYALGGIDAHNAHLLHGFVGIAAIGALST